MNIGFIGAGAAGTTLSLALSAKGYRVAAVASRGGESARRLAARIPGCHAFAGAQEVADACDFVFIATPDAAIASVAASVTWRTGQMVVHLSGALGLEPLASARRAGALVGSFHPLQTLAAVETPAEALAALEGIAFAIEAEAPLRATLEGMARALGGVPLCIRPEDRPLYHASAVMACGYLLALLSESASLWEAMGFSREQALRALLPLARQTLANASRKGLAPGSDRGLDASVTGPIVRGDADTVRRHLEALASKAPRLSSLYSQLGLASLHIAEARGVPLDSLRQIETLLRAHIRSPKEKP
ncbi:MAG: DUF2520 domain-containing protein [Chloroflexota bacterium]|nr:DUF2520 domain-containing protein [Chloroflexota bacterium]